MKIDLEYFYKQELKEFKVIIDFIHKHNIFISNLIYKDTTNNLRIAYQNLDKILSETIDYQELKKLIEKRINKKHRIIKKGDLVLNINKGSVKNENNSSKIRV